MRKTIFVVLCLIFCACNTIFGQTEFPKDKKKYEEIKKDTSYYYGYSGKVSSMDTAYVHALNDLVGNIDKHYKKHALCKIGFEPYKDFLYDQSTKLKLLKGKKNEVALYIKKDVLRQEIQKRRDKIYRLVEDGNKAESECKVKKALKNYYWALMLCYSHPNGKNFTYVENDPYDLKRKEVDLKDYIKDRIEEVLENITIIASKPVKPTDINEKDKLNVELKLRYGGKHDIEMIDYFYNDNTFGSQKEYNYFQNSKSAVTISKDTKILNVLIDIEFEDEAMMQEEEVYMVMKYLNKPLVDLTKRNFVIDIEVLKNMPEEPASAEMPVETPIFNKLNANNDYYVNVMEIVERAINAKKLEIAKNCFSEEGYKSFIKLISYGKYFIIEKPRYTFIDYKDEILCRSIPMQFSFSNKVRFARDVVFRFNKQTGKITSVAFRLSGEAEKNILNKGASNPGSVWNDDMRLVVMNFLEDYQTAYALKDSDYLNKIFSDSALIIVGRKLQTIDLPDRVNFNDVPQYKLIQKSKAEYMESLKNTFKSREYINIDFVESDCMTASKDRPYVFGINVKQAYYSDTYSDVGYLFLLVDLENNDPIIHVRAWQPFQTQTDDLVTIYWFKIPPKKTN